MEAPKPLTPNNYSEIISININHNSTEYKLILKNSNDNILLELLNKKLFMESKYQNILK